MFLKISSENTWTMVFMRPTIGLYNHFIYGAFLYNLADMSEANFYISFFYFE